MAKIISKEILKNHLEEIARISSDTVDSYEVLMNLIKCSANVDKVWDEYDIGDDYQCTEVLQLARERMVARMNRLKVILDTLLYAYENYDEDEDDECDGDCMNCSDYQVTSWDLFLSTDSEEYDEDEEDDDIVFNLTLDPETVDKDTFKAIVKSIYNKLYNEDKTEGVNSEPKSKRRSSTTKSEATAKKPAEESGIAGRRSQSIAKKGETKTKGKK